MGAIWLGCSAVCVERVPGLVERDVVLWEGMESSETGSGLSRMARIISGVCSVCEKLCDSCNLGIFGRCAAVSMSESCAEKGVFDLLRDSMKRSRGGADALLGFMTVSVFA